MRRRQCDARRADPEIHGDDFMAGALFWTTTFHVSAPPHREGDVWRMTSDDVAYSRP
jgi:hypothetical protein